MSIESRLLIIAFIFAVWAFVAATYTTLVEAIDRAECVARGWSHLVC